MQQINYPMHACSFVFHMALQFSPLSAKQVDHPSLPPPRRNASPCPSPPQREVPARAPACPSASAWRAATTMPPPPARCSTQWRDWRNPSPRPRDPGPRDPGRVTLAQARPPDPHGSFYSPPLSLSPKKHSKKERKK